MGRQTEQQANGKCTTIQSVMLNWPQMTKGEKTVSEARCETYGSYFQTQRTGVKSCIEPTSTCRYQSPDHEQMNPAQS